MNTDPMTPQPVLTPAQIIQQQQIQIQQMQIQQMQPQSIHNRTKTAAVLWAFFFGGLGAHKFYLGRPGQGLLYLLFSWTFIPVLVAFVEIFVYLAQSDDSFDRTYNQA